MNAWAKILCVFCMCFGWVGISSGAAFSTKDLSGDWKASQKDAVSCQISFVLDSSGKDITEINSECEENAAFDFDDVEIAGDGKVTFQQCKDEEGKDCKALSGQMSADKKTITMSNPKGLVFTKK